MILSNEQIKDAVSKGEIVLTPFAKSQVEPASYDLSVGSSGITTKGREKRNIKEKAFIEIAAGDFALVLTEEIMQLDLYHTARFGLRSKYARDGLVATVGTQIDPGFHGRLKVGLVNMSTRPIVLSYLDHFLTVEFHRLTQPASRGYQGVYQDQLDLVAEDYEQMALQGSHAFSEAFENLRSLTQSVTSLSEEVQKMAQRIDGNRNNITAWVVAIVAVIFGTASITLTLMK